MLVSAKQHQKPASIPPVGRLEFAPPVDTEDRPPSLATHVQVAGGADAFVLTFYHVSDHTMRRVFRPNESGGAIERKGDHVTVRTDPIARVAVPLSVALEMFVAMFETAGESVPRIAAAAQQTGPRIQEIVATIQGFSAPTKPEGEG